MKQFKDNTTWIFFITQAIIGFIMFFTGCNGGSGDSNTGLTATRQVPMLRASIATDGTEGNLVSLESSLNSDGRFVAFESAADNLVAGDTNFTNDIFLYDCDDETTTRVSIDSNGNESSWMDPSTTPSISSNGQYIAFRSRASNLVPNDTNGTEDIFVHDTGTGNTERVSVASDGSEANGSSRSPSISGNGRFVAFASDATNLDLVVGDLNGFWDIFLHDRDSGTTIRVSVDSNGLEANNHSEYPDVDEDGEYVVFSSEATNLVPNDTNGFRDIFVHDRLTGNTARVSKDSIGNEANWFSDIIISISGNGRYIAFASNATNLVQNDTNGLRDVFVHDQQTGTTERVSIASDGSQANNFSERPSISTDGRYVAFISHATNLDPNDTTGARDVFIHDRTLGTTVKGDVAADGTEANNVCDTPSISGDGQYVAFESVADNLVPNDTNIQKDVFVGPVP